ncbi:unnamed protein product [Candidula unifasciata]|uniref:Uncharacterized protein n=1 Tax=Candidula unifasciata TaxID=100452 RepID=A0A8S3ZKU2_9EUPU|nr:unnamed protein product [Candidula unifasciata]
MFVILSLFSLTVIVSEEFRKWFVSSAVKMYMRMLDQQRDLPGFDMNNQSFFFPLLNANYSDEMPTACEFPKINPYEPSVMKIAGLNRKTLNCEGMFMPDLTFMEGDNTLKVNKSKVEKHMSKDEFKECRYTNVYRHDTNDNDYQYSKWSDPFTEKVELPKDAEFVKVECTNRSSHVVSKTFYHLVPKKEQFDETDSLNLKKRQVMIAPKETLNVIVFGLDTLTRNQFLRGCNDTYSYLMNTLNSFDLSLHSQVGENTFPNFLTLFTGHSFNEVKKLWTDENHMDTFDLIWRTFENAGYKTLYTEDKPLGGAFHYLYNSRPLDLAIEKDKFRPNYRCVGNQVELNFHLDYVTTFWNTFSDKPVFAVTMLSKPTHEEPADAKMFDEHILRTLKSWNDKGHLNRSVLISFSDHGVRQGELRNSVNGHVESKTPYTILTFPKWFLKRYPDVAANLKRNTERLTSHFDTHATLLDLLYFKSFATPPLPPLKHGISLFDKIPWDRTCKDALIPSDFCLCGYKGLKEIHLSSQLASSLTALVISALNSKTDKNICAVYTLVQVIRILQISLNDENATGKQQTIVYKVKLEVNPGGALFEGSVYEHSNGTKWTVGDEIDRLNLYRGQADCLEFPTYRPFCYCKNLLSN